MRRTLAMLVALLTTTAVLTTSGSSVSSAEESPTRSAAEALRYVALGDSYSAASGVLPVDPGAPLSCLRSTRNYPKVIAERTGARLTDVSCGAAQTRDYFRSQSDGVPPQLRALGKRTRLVTMTIGGNDNDVFINSIVQCGSAGVSTLGQGSPCRDRYGRSFARTIRQQTYPDLVKALRAVHRRAPRAEVAILGYPWIVPKQGGCFSKLPIAQGDVPYLRNIQRVLNKAVRRAARASDSTYVNLNKASNGHDACKPIGVRWVEPVLQTTNPVVVHPNALGERRMAARTMRVLGLR